MPSINLKSVEIPYTVIISPKRETIGIEVTLDNGLTVRIPVDTTNSIIEQQILQKEDWILSKLNKFDEIESHPKQKKFVSGERLSYIG